MERIIHGQTIATTHVDSHGERFDREHFRAVCKRLPDDVVAYVQHDGAQRPVCRGFNHRLVALPDGELALVADIEVLDEDRFATFGGFSIAVMGASSVVGNGELVVEDLLNPRYFDTTTAAHRLKVPPGASIRITEHYQRELSPTDVVIVLVVILARDAIKAMWDGFWSAAGTDIWGWLKGLKRKDHSTAPTRVHLHISAKPHRAKLILAFDPEVTPQDSAQIDIQSLASHFLALPDLDTIDRIVATVRPGPVITFEFLSHLDGSTEDPPPLV